MAMSPLSWPKIELAQPQADRNSWQTCALMLYWQPRWCWQVPGPTRAASAAKDNRCAFIGITDFSTFSKSPGTATNETIFLSPEIVAPIEWNELVVSWNVPPGVHLKVEARAIYPDHATQYYTMGLWSDDPAQFPRESVRRQRDQDGTVRTDTLMLSNADAQGAAPDHRGRSRRSTPAQVPRALLLQQHRAGHRSGSRTAPPGARSWRSRSGARASMKAAAAGAARPRSRWSWRIGASSCIGPS